MKNENCAYCAEGELVSEFAIKIIELPASKVYLFREQSHRGRVIVASKSHVSELVDLDRRTRQAFMDDVAKVATAIHRVLNPDKVNYGAYGDTGCHAHFHLVPKYANDPFEWGDTFAMNPKRTYLSEAEYAELVAKLAAELYVGEGYDLRKSLETMWREISADGRVTLCESAILLAALERFEGSGATLDALIGLLRTVRADGKVTSEESAQIVEAINGLLK